MPAGPPLMGRAPEPPAAVRGGACGRPRAPHALPFVSPWRRRRRRGLRTRARKPPGSEEATATMVVRGPRGHQSVCPRASLSARPRPERPAPGPARARGPRAAPHPPSRSPWSPPPRSGPGSQPGPRPRPLGARLPSPLSGPRKGGDSGGGPGPQKRGGWFREGPAPHERPPVRRRLLRLPGNQPPSQRPPQHPHPQPPSRPPPPALNSPFLLPSPTPIPLHPLPDPFLLPLLHFHPMPPARNPPTDIDLNLYFILSRLTLP